MFFHLFSVGPFPSAVLPLSLSLSICFQCLCLCNGPGFVYRYVWGGISVAYILVGSIIELRGDQQASSSLLYSRLMFFQSLLAIASHFSFSSICSISSSILYFFSALLFLINFVLCHLLFRFIFVFFPPRCRLPFLLSSPF